MVLRLYLCCKKTSDLAHIAFAYKGGVNTIRTSTHRFTRHTNGYVELYDHTSAEGETKNIAKENPELVKEMIILLKEKLVKK